MSKRTIIITISGITALLIALGVFLFASQKPQELRQKAAVPGGSATITLAPKTNTIIQGTKTSILLSASILNSSVDGFQVVASISGKIPTDLTFTPATPSGMRQIGGTLAASPTGKQVEIAYITQNPEGQPFADTNFITLGSLVFTAPGVGDMIVSFDTTLSKIHQHSEQNQPGNDILDLPEAQTYSFVPPPTISMAQPNGHETLIVGQTYIIKWNSTTSSLPKVSLRLISDQNPDTIIATDIENTGSYNWNVISDNLTTSGAKFKIRATSASIYGITVSDDSNDYLFLNHLPTIITSSLPIGQVGQPYIASINGSDPDSLDLLSMTIEGISNYGLTYTCQQTSTKIQCNLSGTPTSPAPSPVPILVSLSDNHTGNIQKTLSLIIKPLPDLTVSSISRSTSGVALGLCNSGGPINKTFSYTIAGTRSTSAFPATLGENSCQKFLTPCSSKIDDPCKWPTITAVIDSGKIIPESNENNNSLKVPLCQPKPECPIIGGRKSCISPTPPSIGWCP